MINQATDATRRRLDPWALIPGILFGVIQGVHSGWLAGVLSFIFIAGFWTFINGLRNDYGRIVSDAGDEREHQLYNRSMLLAYGAVMTVAVIGAVVETAHGRNSGPYINVCAVGGGVQLLAPLLLKRFA